jgi:hypothetical protein
LTTADFGDGVETSRVDLGGDSGVNELVRDLAKNGVERVVAVLSTSLVRLVGSVVTAGGDLVVNGLGESDEDLGDL